MNQLQAHLDHFSVLLRMSHSEVAVLHQQHKEAGQPHFLWEQFRFLFLYVYLGEVLWIALL